MFFFNFFLLRLITELKIPGKNSFTNFLNRLFNEIVTTLNNINVNGSQSNCDKKQLKLI